MTRARGLALAAALALAASVTGQSVTPATRKDGLGRRAPDFTLVTQDEKVFTLGRDGRGRPILLTFIFTSCPGACPYVVEECLQAARAAGKGKPENERPLVVAVSFDPAVDTPKRLREHMAENKMKRSEIVFLTGGAGAVERATHDWEVNVGRDEKGDIFHGFQTAVIDREGVVVARYFGAGIDLPKLTADVKAAAR
jgi:protein SCO1/2